MLTKSPTVDTGKLTVAAKSYQRLLTKAIRSASHEDTATLQRLGVGLTALTRAFTAIEKLKDQVEDRTGIPTHYDVMGNPIWR